MEQRNIIIYSGIIIILIIIAIILKQNDQSTIGNPSGSENIKPTANEKIHVRDTINIHIDILSERKIPNHKYSADISLNIEVPESLLVGIAYVLRDKQEVEKYDSIFLTYYLPNMEIGKDYWAKTNFYPDLQIEYSNPTNDLNDIPEFSTKNHKTSKTVTDESNYKTINQDFEEIQPHRNKTIIGRWIDKDPYTGCIIEFYKQNGKVYRNQIISDGSWVVELETKTINGKKIYAEDGNSFNEYYIINSKGNLEVYDFQGYITTYPKHK